MRRDSQYESDNNDILLKVFCLIVKIKFIQKKNCEKQSQKELEVETEEKMRIL